MSFYTNVLELCATHGIEPIISGQKLSLPEDKLLITRVEFFTSSSKTTIRADPENGAFRLQLQDYLNRPFYTADRIRYDEPFRQQMALFCAELWIQEGKYPFIDAVKKYHGLAVNWRTP